MKRLKEIILAIIIIAVTVALINYMYRNQAGKYSRELAKRIAELSPRGGPPETIEGLRQAIALYEDQIERNVREGAQTGVYWKILAIRLADKNLHNDALGALERAIYYNTEDAILFYLTGVSAANIAKSLVGFSAADERERERYYKLSEASYLRALEIDVTYTKPMYGLSVLYVFELDRPQDAIPYLERYLTIQSYDVSAMFVLARAYYMTENFIKAVEQYDRIISRTKDQKIREEALINRDIIQGRLYE
ncbi:MAG: tetratricopeptide repeat protein [Treponema sp.]|jgi:tetratricopeptide (TPR) repeat protein|nr:tetratricopeptide repeat protein [Treponema sp.]